MELINRNYKCPTTTQRLLAQNYCQIRNNYTLTFSSKAAVAFGLIRDYFIHFLEDEEYWYFYVNSDSDGYQINKKGKGDPGVIMDIFIMDMHLIDIIKKRTGHRIGQYFQMRMTDAKLNGCNLVEIDFKKPIHI